MAREKVGSVTLIADDYGLGECHDRAMRELIENGAIDGVSVLVEWCSTSSAKSLLSLRGKCRIGLHLNLTLAPQGEPVRPSRLLWLIGGLFGQGRQKVQTALYAQYAKFVELFGFEPDFIDGHEHCHAYPSLSPEVLAFASSRKIPVRAIRLWAPPRSFKERVLNWLGLHQLAAAKKAGATTNDFFAGVLPLGKPEEAMRLLDETLTSLDETPPADGECWVMCHPGDAKDPIQINGHSPELRTAEAEYLLRRTGS